MAIIKCRECGKDCSNDARSCPHCGASDPDEKQNKDNVQGLLIGKIFFGCFGLLIVGCSCLCFLEKLLENIGIT